MVVGAKHVGKNADGGKQYRTTAGRIPTLLPAATYAPFVTPRYLVQNDEPGRIVHFRELASTLLTTAESYVKYRLGLKCPQDRGVDVEVH